MIKFPFTTLQQCNLDWIMQKLHDILKFMPMNGSAGDVLQRNVDGAAWMPISAVSLDIHGLTTIPDVEAVDELAIYDNSQQGNFKITVSDLLDNAPVTSVNGQTGDVVLTIPSVPVTSVNGQTGDVVLSIPTDTSDLNNDSGFITAAQAPVQSVNGQTGNVIVSGGGAVDSVNGQTGTVILGKSDVGLGNVDNVQQYSASNPPPYPVTSVNGQTGAVTISGAGLTKDLLWTNASPNASFPAQTIPLDLSGYPCILIETGYSTDASTCDIFVVPTGRSYNYIVGVSSRGIFVNRPIVITNTGVQFLAGNEMTTFDGTWSSDNLSAIPYRIYGLK